MSDILLTILTHLGAFAAGGAVTRAWTMRRLQVIEHDGRLALEMTHRDDEETS